MQVKKYILVVVKGQKSIFMSSGLPKIHKKYMEKNFFLSKLKTKWCLYDRARITDQSFSYKKIQILNPCASKMQFFTIIGFLLKPLILKVA